MEIDVGDILCYAILNVRWLLYYLEMLIKCLHDDLEEDLRSWAYIISIITNK